MRYTIDGDILKIQYGRRDRMYKTLERAQQLLTERGTHTWDELELISNQLYVECFPEKLPTNAFKRALNRVLGRRLVIPAQFAKVELSLDDSKRELLEPQAQKLKLILLEEMQSYRNRLRKSTEYYIREYGLTPARKYRVFDPRAWFTTK